MRMWLGKKYDCFYYYYNVRNGNKKKLEIYGTPIIFRFLFKVHNGNIVAITKQVSSKKWFLIKVSNKKHQKEVNDFAPQLAFTDS